jgi:glycosyltransferase involved in cell wall biosynthesis
MGGTRATHRAEGDKPDARGEARAAEVRHWRELATRRESALQDLTQRPLVRAALAVDRRLAVPRRRLRRPRARVRSVLDRTALVLAGLRTHRVLRARGAALQRTRAALGPPPDAPSVSVITLRGDRPEMAAGVSRATGDVLCFTPDGVDALEPGWLARLTSPLRDGVVATTPTLLQPARGGWRATEHDLLVRAAGYAIELDDAGTPLVRARSAGEAPAAGRGPVDVAAAPLGHLAVDRRAFLAAGGLAAAASDDLAAIDLCARLRERGGRVQHVPDALVFDRRPVPSRTSLRHPIDPTDAEWRRVVEDHGATLATAPGPGAGAAPTRWVITTAVPSARLAPRWGDWHLAEALARALRALGQDVHVQARDRADSLATRAHDIHLVLHGLAAVRPTPGQRHVLWVISHPESVDPAECDAADLVLVASPRFADDLRGRTATPVEVLLQATDPARFRPLPADPRHEHPVTVVAKTRDVQRAVVTDALAAGVRPAVYGYGWDGLIDPHLIVADHVDNELLPVVYSSAGVVLNDHWDTMAAWGFVSNRIFDVLACGTPVISDDLPEVHDLFGDAVPTYRTARQLGDLVAEALDDPAQARARAARGRAIVLEHHTFDHRARALLDLVAQHAPPDAPATRGRPGVR